MGLRWRDNIDILAMLKEKGYNTNKIRQDKIFSESTLQKLRQREGLSWENIERICRLLEVQPGDLIEYVPDSAKNE